MSKFNLSGIVLSKGPFFSFNVSNPLTIFCRSKTLKDDMRTSIIQINTLRTNREYFLKTVDFNSVNISSTTQAKIKKNLH
jgi:hypothetical protein